MAMKDSDLEELLRRWGRVYGEAPPSEWDEGLEADMGLGGSVHPLAIAMRNAPGRIERCVSVAYRRRIRVGEREWSRDPMPCSETRHFSGALYFSGAEVGRVEPEVSRVERAAMDLYRINTQRGLVLRAQYCKRGTQREKTDWINGQGRATALTLRTYRDELAHARTWVHARIA